MRRETPKDLAGNKLNYRQEQQAKRNYKRDTKPWNFPFREAFERAKERDKAK